jgi:hypothetical protein
MLGCWRSAQPLTRVTNAVGFKARNVVQRANVVIEEVAIVRFLLPVGWRWE